MDSKRNLSYSTLFSKSSLGNISSHLGTNDMHRLRIRYNVLSNVILSTLSPLNWADLVKPGFFFFYEKFLKVNVRFPLHLFIRSILNFFKMAPMQLMPNSWRLLLVLLILSRISKAPFPLDLTAFLYFYYPKDVGDTSHFSFYHRRKSEFLVTGVPFYEKGVKTIFSLCPKIRHKVVLNNCHIFGPNYVETTNFSFLIGH